MRLSHPNVVNAPAISIITPCYNAAPYVGCMLDSVRAQTFLHWEHAVLDDGSTDGSAAIVERYAASEPRLRLVRQPNAGCARTRNRGAALCSADSRYLLFLDADDVLEPDALRTMVEYLDAHPPVGLAYCDFRIIDGGDSIVQENPCDNGWAPRRIASRFGVRELPADVPETPLESILAITAIIPSVCFLRRSVYDQTPGWDEEMGVIYEDVGLYLHMALRSNVHYVPRKLLRYRRHSTQSSTNAERFDANLQKLYAKWCSGHVPGLTADQQARLDAATRFRERRIMPQIGWHAGLRHLRAGRVAMGMKYWAGAARRYAPSLFSMP